MRQTFNTDFDTITWVASGYFLAQAAVIPITCYLTDRRGSRLVFLVATAIFVGGSVLCAFAPTETTLIGARIIQGIGGGALFPTSFAIAYQAFPRDEWGRATTIIGVPVLLAPVLGPVLGGYLTTAVNWRAIFAINLPIGIAALLLAWLILRPRAAVDQAGTSSGRFDVLGFILALAGFAILVYGLTQAGIHGWGNATADRAMIVGLVLLAALVVVELRVSNPVLDVRLFLNPTFAKSSVVMWVMVAALFGSLFLIPFFFERVEGQSALTAGQILILQGVAAAIGIALAGELYNRIGPRWLVTAGVVAVATSMIGFTHFTVATSGLSLQGWLILRGLGLGLTTTPLQNLALSVVPHRDLARGSSLVNVTRQVLSAAGVAGLAAFATQRSADHAASLAAGIHAGKPSSSIASCLSSPHVAACVERHAIVLGLNDTFLVIAIGCVLTIGLALFVGRDPSLERLGIVGIEQLATSFPHLEKRELVEMASRGRPIAFQPGDVIVREGDPPDDLYLVTSGEVTVSRDDGAGNETTLRTITTGGFFGEVGVMQGIPRTATVRAAAQTEVLAIPATAFREIVSSSDDALRDLQALIDEYLSPA